MKSLRTILCGLGAMLILSIPIIVFRNSAEDLCAIATALAFIISFTVAIYLNK